MKRVSRRELGQLAAGIAAASAVPLEAQTSTPTPSGYIGPLTGVSADIANRRFDPVAFTRDLYAAAPRRLRFQAQTRAQARKLAKGPAVETHRARGRISRRARATTADDT